EWQLVFEKNSIRKGVFARLLRPPSINVPAPVFRAAERRGEFWRLFGPLSASPASFGVTPVEPKSMPNPVLLKIELPSKALLVPAVTEMPAPPLKAMVLAAPGATPPIRLAEPCRGLAKPCTITPSL